MKIMPVSSQKILTNIFLTEQDIKMINTQISTLKQDISPQIIITEYKCVGKTFLLKKVLNDKNSDILTTFIDLSEVMGRQKGKLTEEEVLKALLIAITETIAKNKKSCKKLINKITSNIKKLNEKL